MNGLLASLRLPVALCGRWMAAAAVPATTAPVDLVDAVVGRASAPFRTLARSASAPRVDGAPAAPPLPLPVPLAIPVVVLEPVLDATPLPPQRVAPRVGVCAAHLVDPVGLRVVPYRPNSRWPLRRAAPRIFDPFRGFPLRSAHLGDLIDGSLLER